MSIVRALYWALVAATLLLYGVMVLWSLPQVAAAAGGQVAFDMRPGGYTFAEAMAFLAALSEEGQAFYLGTQHRLDSAYPAMLAMVLALGGYGLAGPDRRRWLARAIAAAAIIGAVADYLENQAVVAMLEAGPAGLTADMVTAAS
ncbi:MAG: hypothetical protein KDK00_15600, partial [Rhodobacteraceae bacterium]|nr:hypothetical protein [Paracoccaceae bacterium]